MRSCSTLHRVVVSCLFVLSFHSLSWAHGTQTAWCITDGGSVRVWIEHWHGNIQPSQVGNALVTINVTDSSTGITTTFQQIPQGVAWDTTKDNLPDCKAGLTVLSTCPGRADVYNDWVYWDFVPPACYVDLTIEIVNVVGSESWYFDEACGTLYPVSFTSTFIDCAPPQMTCISENRDVEVNAAGCGANVTSGLEPTVLFDDCTPTADIGFVYQVTGATTASGNGYAHIYYNKGVSTVNYTATDDGGNTSTCSFTVTVDDTTDPVVSCPADITFECGSPILESAITDWLSLATATDICGVMSFTNTYSPTGFSYHDPNKNGKSSTNKYAAFGSLALANISSKEIMNSMFDCNESISFNVQEMKGEDLFDYPIKVQIDKRAISNYSGSQMYFSDAENRVVPHWIESQNDEILEVWLKIPKLVKDIKSTFSLNYGKCVGAQFEKKDVFGEGLSANDYSKAQVKPILLGKGISNLMFLNDEVKYDDSNNVAASMMTCDCTATQGGQSFPINALQNAEDDVSFFSYGTPNGASANTGLEVNDAVVLFLYENTLTGEISLFILIDDAGGGNGGNGSVDFYCLPSSATLDFSDDPGEITGIFPTVTANWGWADCCTDGALLGNLGCNTTFDFFPNFTTGINAMQWVSGTLASPVYTTFGSSTEPVRIQCGNGQPECCPNANEVTSNDASCPNVADGSIDVIPDPNGAPYTFLWSTGATTEDLNNVLYGSYMVTITDKDNCEQILDIDIGVTEEPVLVNCPEDITLDYTGNTVTISESDLGFTVNYNCTDPIMTSCQGCGVYDCSAQNTTIPVTITVKNSIDAMDMCTVNVFIRNVDPQITCPQDLIFECGDPILEGVITDWLDTATSSDSDVNSITNSYSATGFSMVDDWLQSQNIAYQSPSKYSVQTEPKDYYFNLDNLKSSSAAMISQMSSQTVIFTATDLCGNTSTCSAQIIIQDTTEPEITCPTDITIECGDPNNSAIVTNWLDNATANDLCDPGVTVTNNFTALPTNACGNTGSTTITFTATDCDNNTNTCQATITVVDTEDPVFLMKPQDLIVECDGAGNTTALNAWIANNGGGMADDDCDAMLVWSTTSTVISACDNTSTTTYTFTVADDCGNDITAMADFIIEDTTPPVLTVPADVTMACNIGSNPGQITALLNGVSATDICSDNADVVVVNQLLSTSVGCGGTSVTTYQIIATDECGNSAEDFLTFTTTDAVIPAVTCPSALSIECGDPDRATKIQAWLDSAVAPNDNCSDITITHNFDGDIADACPATETVTFTFTDDCGNSRTCNGTVTIDDTVSPVFVNCPANVTLNVSDDNCNQDIIFSTPVANDNCDNIVDVSLTSALGSGDTFPVGTTSVAFEAEDDCGNTATCTFIITIVDSDAPSIFCPSNSVTVCTDVDACTWEATDQTDPVTPENCTGFIVTYSVTNPDNSTTNSTNTTGIATLDGDNINFDLGTSTVVYTVTDANGNTAICGFDVVVEDCQKPVITCPTNIINAACGAAIPASFIATATDNCMGTVTVTSSVYNTISGCGNTDTQVIQFEAVDDAGNVSYCLAEYTTVDIVAPVISTMASDDSDTTCDDALGDFQDWLANQGGAAATDACGSVSWSYDITNVDNTDCSGVSTIAVTFTASDDCGNTSTTNATFSGVDDTDPTISCPADITLNCGNENNTAIVTTWLATASGSDDCGTTLITNDYTALSTAGCSTTGTTTVTFTATDDCGNTATCMSTIVITDTELPSFVIRPLDLSIECDGAGNAAAISTWLAANGSGVAEDNCDMDVAWTNAPGAAVAICGNSTTTVYTFTITDDCGNTATASASVIIEDTTNPTINPPAAPMTVECDGSGNSAALAAWLASDGNVTASDICDTDLTITRVLTNTISACGGATELVYEFTAIDDCGNEAQTLSSFIIQDTTDPVITCPADLVLECGTPSNNQLINAWLTSITPTDLCSGVQLSHDFDGNLPSSCGGSVTVTFTATDDCGNTSTCSADIIMNDITIPDFINCPDGTLTVNADISACGNNIIFSTPVAVDNCDNNVSVVQTAGPISGTEIAAGSHTITFTATDDCLNSITCTFTLVVVDNAVPSIECPDGPITACASATTCMWESVDIGPITAQDNCPDYTVTYAISGTTSSSGSGDASGTFFNLGSSTVVYTVTDDNSNTSTCEFAVVVNDCDAPVITCVSDMSVVCDGTGNTAALNTWLATATSADNCQDDPDVTSSIFNTTSGCGGSSTTTYQFYAVDDYGNESYCYADFIIMDNVMPAISTPASDETVICDGTGNSEALLAWLNNNGGAVATDMCGSITWSNDYSGTASSTCQGSESYTVVFSATDACGNVNTTSSDFIIMDNVDPVIDCPDNIILSCNTTNTAGIIANWLSSATATDNCSTPVVTNDYTAPVTTGCGDTGVTTVIFTATDACGNDLTCSATITIIDDAMPIIATPASDLILECSGATNAAQITAWLGTSGGAIGSDACDDDPVWTNMISDASFSCGTAGTTTYTFTLTDACGNTASTSADVVIGDTTPPSLTLPADTTVDCDGAGNITDLNAWLATAMTAMDCGAMPSIDNRLDNTISNCGSANEQVFLFTATDACGNATTGTASFTVRDITDPVIVCPTANLILECGDNTNQSLINTWLASVTATDVCSNPTIINDFNTNFVFDCGVTGVHTVTFTATDMCDNTSTCSATITIEDTTDPNIDCPNDLILVCNNPNNDALIATWLALATVDDDCGSVELTNNYTSMLDLDCDSSVGTVVTFTATDACDNISTCTASIILNDNENPTITNFPVDITVECAAADLATQLSTWLSTNGGGQATDNCDTDLIWSNAPQVVLPLCGNTSSTPYVFTVTDDCGNTATAIANFITEDTTDPMLVLPTDMTTVECDGAGNTADLNAWLGSVDGSDTCSDDVSIATVLENTISGCGDTQTLVYRFTVSDDCGNTTVANSTFIIEDTTGPMISCPASDLALECGNPNNINLVSAWLSTVTATDDCSSVSVTNNFVALPTVLACNGGSVTITFTATDGCDNVETCTADITVNDTQAPTFLACPSDITLNTDGECGNTPVFTSPTAIDNCEVTVTQTAGMLSGTPLSLGDHTIEFTATDDCGLTATCSWIITVVDIAAPLVLCPSEDVVRCVNTDPCQWTSDSSVAPSIDIENCPGYSVVYTIGGATAATTGNDDATGEVFELGTSTVEYTITDSSGNTNSCVFNVLVEDCQAPMITTCPADITVTCGDPAATTLATWQATVISTDLCDDDVEITSLLFNTISGCGSTNTEVYLFTATDDAGNMTTCLSSYTIEDVSMPVIICPAVTLELECGNPSNDALVAAWLATASATDDCDTPTLMNDFTSLPIDLVCEGGGSVTVTFTAEDACGNSSLCTAVITINDTTAPVFDNCPSDITLNTDGECGATPIFSMPTAADNCEVIVTQTSLLGSGDEFPLGTSTVEFTATDRCGLTATCSWTITVVDVTGPLVFCPSTDVVKCVDGGTCLWTSDIDVSPRLDVENCPGYTIVYTISGATPATSGNDDASGEVFSLGTSTVEYTITDSSNNVSTCSFDVIVEDCEVPILTCAADITVTCGDPAATTIVTWQATATATDNCTNDVAITSVLYNTISDCGSTNTEAYLYTATDNAGNTSTCIASYTIEDRTNPAIICPAATLELECGDINNDNLIAAWLATATATDDCDAPEITHNYVAPPLGFTCDGFGLITVVFTATDLCGNTSNCTADISINDTSDPVINCPSDLILTCNNVNNATLITNWLALATADDSCRDVVVTNDYNNMLTLDCTSAAGTVVTFTAIDDCDNEVSCTASIILNDNELPTITTFPTDFTVECADPNRAILLGAWLINNGGAAASDNCDTQLAWTNEALTEILACDATGLIPYMFTVTDDCGNTATAIANFITEDTTLPSLDLPEDITVECDGNGNTAALSAWLNSADGEDTCSDVDVVNYLDNTISGCGDGEVFVYRFMVTDDCGNNVSDTATFSIVDGTDPVLICPAVPLNLECGNPNNDNLIAAWLSTATATDDCSTPVITNNYAALPVDLVCQGGGTMNVTFTATDACGNDTNCVAVITVNDITPPSFISCPTNITLNTDGACGNTPIFSMPVANDNCSVTVVQTQGLSSGSEFPIGTELIEFTATDACGLEATCSWTITIVDITGPLIFCPSNDVIKCADIGTCEWISDIDVSPRLDLDNCPDYTIIYTITGATSGTGTDDATGDIFELGTSTVTYTITDASMNVSSCSFDVIVEDCESPVLVCASDLTVTCGDPSAVSLSDWQETATSSDNCDADVTIEAILFNTVSACGGTSTEVYLYTATDDAGNTSTCLASYTVEDVTAPEILCPVVDLELECGDTQNNNLIASWLATVSATDACDNPSITNNFVDLPTDLVCEGGGVMMVTFVAEDACGNTSSCIANITVNDTTDPTFDYCPVDVTLNTDGDCGNTPIFSTPSVSDNCDASVSQTMGLSSGTVFPLGTTTVEFTAVDSCGNSSICSWDITIVDIENPIIDCPSVDIVICVDPGTCQWISNNSVAPIVDIENCPGYTVVYNITGATTASGTDDATGEIFELGISTVTYTITDGSDNETTCSFDVIVEDCEVPMLVCAEDITVICGDALAMSVALWQATATASDNCDTDVDISSVLYNTISGCGSTNTEVYLYTATDDQGNTSTCLASYTIEDETSPEIVCPAPTLELECGDANNDNLIAAWLATVTATDGCDSPEITHNYVAPPLGFTCEGFGLITVVFTATDACGNTTNCMADITINDTVNPTIDCPEDLILSCNNTNNEALINLWLASAIGDDNCGDAVVTHDFNNMLTLDCTSAAGTVVTFTATDKCDNTETCIASIILVDNEKPLIMTPPSDLFLECDGAGNTAAIDAWLAANTANDVTMGMMATDNCGVVTLTVVEGDSADNCGVTTVITYTFTATDLCGNTVDEIAYVNIEDTTDPVLTLPTAVATELCTGDVEVTFTAWLESASATDVCSDPTVEYVLFQERELCDGTSTLIEREYTFTAMDACNNETTDNAIFTIIDDIDPTITAPADLEMECGDDFSALSTDWLQTFIIVDDCQSPTVTNDFDGNLPDKCGGTVMVTWTVTDDCGATASTSANIIIADDTTAPIFDYCPADITITTEVGQCDAVINYGTPTASDCNDPITIIKTSGPDVGTMLDAGVTETVEFTTTDACGNTRICLFTITVLDEQLPEISCPSNDVIKCTDIATCTWTSDNDVSPIDVTDNCPNYTVMYKITGATVSTGNDDAAGEIFNLGDSYVEYFIMDANGNEIDSCEFMVVVNDCEVPTITCNDELAIACGWEDIDLWYSDIRATALDNCDSDLTVDTLLLTDISSCGNTFEKVYLFTVTDDAGNTATCTATYMTIDEVVPSIITEAEDMVLECDGTNQSIFLQGWLNSYGGATVTDDCGDEIVWTNNYTGAVNMICPGTTEVPVTFTATDDCGNASSTSAVFRVEDTTPPVMVLPADLTLNCGDPFNPFFVTIWASDASAIDQCNGITLVTNRIVEVEDLCGSTTITHYEFSAVDACSNLSRDTLTITTIDLVAPEFTDLPEDLIIECGATADLAAWINNNGGAEANDNCSDDDLVWTYTEEVASPACGLTETTEYTFIVEDNCGNTSTTQASVIIIDTTSPELFQPADRVEECGNIQMTLLDWIASATATDVCGTVEIEHVLWNSFSGCGSTFYERYLFTATDECGNSSTAFAEYQTLDRTDPIITCPQDLILECGDVNNTIGLQSWLDSVTAVDAFGCSQVNLTYDIPGGLPDLSCDASTGITITFEAQDECGNTSTCQANVYIVDTTNPTFVNCPTDLTVNVDVDLCGANTIFSTPVADDNCEVTVEQTVGLSSGSEFEIGLNNIEFTATDACGNTALCAFTITVIDTDVPLILCPSNNLTVTTDSGVCTWLSDDQVNPSVSVENCPGQTISYTVTGVTTASGMDQVQGVVFNLGISEVCYTISDLSNNSSQCCFTVEVIDTELPLVVCPADTILIANKEIDGICYADFEWAHPIPTDNCGVDQLDVQIMSPDWSTTDIIDVTPGALETAEFAAGFSYVNYTVTDINGNTNTCSFKVDVIGIKHEKSIQRVTQNPDDSYCTEYSIRVWNTGNNVGRYTLWDLPAFDDDFIILSAEYSSSVHSLTTLDVNVPADGWLLGDAQFLPGFGSHTYILTVCTIVDLKDEDTPGDAMYTKCGERQTPATANMPGQALFNESLLDVNQDDVPDLRDSVCADIPYITHEKDFVGYTRNTDRTYDINYKVTVANIGGAIGDYDLWDIPYFDDDFVINGMSYTTDIDDGSGGELSGGFVDNAPYVLAEDVVLDYDSTHCYFLTFNVSINLSDPETIGDELYDYCGTTSPDGIPQPGEGLYNETYLDRSDDGNPEEIEYACGDIEIVDLALRKTLETTVPYSYGDELTFKIEIFNQGNIDLYNIEINDYLPIGYDFVAASNDPLWSQISPTELRYVVIPGPLAPASSTFVELNLVLNQTTGGYKDWDNYAEIHYMEDVDQVDKSLEDVDSTPDNIDNNDNPVMVGDSDDDLITKGGPYFNEDEDDHDPAGPYIFDLALNKIHDAASSTYQFGGTQIYDITVFNQGNEDATNIVIVDTLPCGLIFDQTSTVNIAQGWLYDFSTNEVSVTITSTLQPGNSVIVPIALELQSCYDPEGYVNYAEIENADDTDVSTSGFPLDIDSTPDDDNTNDVGGTPNDPAQDDVVSDPGIIDEDDHDPEELEFLDLALRKTIDNEGPYSPGDFAEFEIEIFNQGTVDAYNIEITDYLNTGFLFNSGGVNAGWTIAGSYVDYTYAGPLAAGDSATITITLEIQVPANASFDVWINEAEISAADNNSDPNDTSLSDIDSYLDNDPDNDNNVQPGDENDNVIDEHAIPDGDDEDDNDVASVIVVGKLCGVVWNDCNGDGIQNDFNSGLSGIQVEVYDEQGVFVESVTTNNSGFYESDYLLPANYYIKVIKTDDYLTTDFRQGQVLNLDSDINGSNGECTSALAYVQGGACDKGSFDVGLYKCIPIGELVWYDINENDVKDAFENGINGLTVELWKLVNGDWTLYGSQFSGHKPGTPSDDGYFKFCAPPGIYEIRMDIPYNALVPARKDIGSNASLDLTNSNESAFDSDLSYDQRTGAFAINCTMGDICNIGAGYYPMSQVGNRVWFDEDGDGLQGVDETGIHGVLVEAFDADDNMINSTTTDFSGKYMIDYLGQNDYYLKFSPPFNYAITNPNQGPDTIDSDVDHSNGFNTTSLISLNSGDSIVTIDAGVMLGVVDLSWLSFEGQNKGAHNHLTWSTATETNTSHFVIERSFDNDQNFQEIGKVAASGYSVVESNYEIRDYDIEVSGAYYYRLMQVDIDEAFTYSNIVKIDIRKEKDSSLELYPNPARSSVNIDIYMSRDDIVKVSIWDVQGKLVAQNLINEEMTTGLNTRVLDIRAYAAGMYSVKIEVGNTFFKKKLIILKD